jgi:LmbE family N-acetylglucosaminyl deacetylase
MIQPIRISRQRPGSAHAKLFGTGSLLPTTHCAVIIAHPGDEIVGAGCLISKLADVSVLHVTDGAPGDTKELLAAGYNNGAEYIEARRRECIAALALAHVSENRVIDFGIVNQKASLHLVKLTKRVTTFLQQSSADIVVTHPYEGAHPDHDATAFAAHTAVRLMKENGFRPPVIFEMALRPGKDGKAKLPEFLPGREREVTTLLLNERARALKQRMFDCLETQSESLRLSPAAPERFRQPMHCDFTSPPHPGKLHYESFTGALRSRDWQLLARSALSELLQNNYRQQLRRIG